MQYTEELGMPERQIVRFSTRKLSLVEIWRESLNLLRLRDFTAARIAADATASAHTTPCSRVAGVPREAPSRALHARPVREFAYKIPMCAH